MGIVLVLGHARTDSDACVRNFGDAYEAWVDFVGVRLPELLDFPCDVAETDPEYGVPEDFVEGGTTLERAAVLDAVSELWAEFLAVDAEGNAVDGSVAKDGAALKYAPALTVRVSK